MAKNALKGFVVGALVAAAASLLLAPKSGAKTRKDILKLIKTVTKKMEREFGDLGNLTKERYDELVAGALIEYAKTTKTAKGFLDEAKELLQKQWNEIQKELKK